MTCVLHLMFAGGAVLLRGSLVNPPAFRGLGVWGLGCMGHKILAQETSSYAAIMELGPETPALLWFFGHLIP